MASSIEHKVDIADFLSELAERVGLTDGFDGVYALALQELLDEGWTLPPTPAASNLPPERIAVQLFEALRDAEILVGLEDDSVVSVIRTFWELQDNGWRFFPPPDASSATDPAV